MKNLDVICPGCRENFHATTSAYNPYQPARGDMVRLRDPWRKWGWCSFGDGYDGRPPKIAETPNTLWAMMDCPGCGAPMALNGRLIVRNPDGSAFVPPPEDFYNPKPAEIVIPVYSDDDLDAEWNARINSKGIGFAESKDDKIFRLRGEGLSYAKIGRQVGLSGEMVRQIVKKAENEK